MLCVDVVVLLVGDGRAEDGVDVLEANVVAAADTVEASSRGFPVDLGLCEEVIERYVALAVEEEAVPVAVGEWQL